MIEHFHSYDIKNKHINNTYMQSDWNKSAIYYSETGTGRLFLMKLSNEALQILPYFWNKKTQIVFFCFSFRATLDL